jgi:ribosomal protein L29
MKIKELRTKSAKELEDVLEKTTQKIKDSQFYHARSRSKNVKEIREWRKLRARLLTILGEK